MLAASRVFAASVLGVAVPAGLVGAVATAGAVTAAAATAGAATTAGAAKPVHRAGHRALPTAAQLVGEAQRAIHGITRVHLDGQLSEVVHGVGVYVAVDLNAGPSDGTLSETIASRGKRVRFGALLTASGGWCTGDPDALTAGCALPASVAFAAAGHWVSFRASSAPYRALAGSTTFAGQLAGLLPSSPARFTVSATRARGVLELRGPADRAAGFPAGTVEVLDLATSGPVLPVSVRFRAPGTVSSSEHFSHWGRPFAVHAPTHVMTLE